MRSEKLAKKSIKFSKDYFEIRRCNFVKIFKQAVIRIFRFSFFIFAV